MQNYIIMMISILSVSSNQRHCSASLCASILHIYVIFIHTYKGLFTLSDQTRLGADTMNRPVRLKNRKCMFKSNKNSILYVTHKTKERYRIKGILQAPEQTAPQPA